MASTLISTADLRGHIETGLPDTALERLIDGADEEIVRRAGPHAGAVTVALSVLAPGALVALPAPAQTVVSVTEQRGSGAARPVASSDYQADFGGRFLRRLRGWWPDKVIVVYIPAPDQYRRLGVLIGLVKLDLAFSGLAGQRIGQSQEQTSLVMLRERERILGRLRQLYGGAGLLV